VTRRHFLTGLDEVQRTRHRPCATRVAESAQWLFGDCWVRRVSVVLATQGGHAFHGGEYASAGDVLGAHLEAFDSGCCSPANNPVNFGWPTTTLDRSDASKVPAPRSQRRRTKPRVPRCGLAAGNLRFLGR
jgi:hypothetical protein